MTNKEKFLALVSNEKTETLEKIEFRIANRARLRESRSIAYKVLDKLEELGWSQKDLAEKMEVSPQQVNKIVKGQENLTLATQVKLQEILNIPILASYYEKDFQMIGEIIQKSMRQGYEKPQAKILSISKSMQSVERKAKTVKFEEEIDNYETYTKQA